MITEVICQLYKTPISTKDDSRFPVGQKSTTATSLYYWQDKKAKLCLYMYVWVS